MVYLEGLMGLPEKSIISFMCIGHHSVLCSQFIICIINLFNTGIIAFAIIAVLSSMLSVYRELSEHFHLPIL